MLPFKHNTQNSCGLSLAFHMPLFSRVLGPLIRSYLRQAFPPQLVGGGDFLESSSQLDLMIEMACMGWWISWLQIRWLVCGLFVGCFFCRSFRSFRPPVLLASIRDLSDFGAKSTMSHH